MIGELLFWRRALANNKLLLLLLSLQVNRDIWACFLSFRSQLLLLLASTVEQQPPQTWKLPELRNPSHQWQGLYLFWGFFKILFNGYFIKIELSLSVCAWCCPWSKSPTGRNTRKWSLTTWHLAAWKVKSFFILRAYLLSWQQISNIAFFIIKRN